MKNPSLQCCLNAPHSCIVLRAGEVNVALMMIMMMIVMIMMMIVMMMDPIRTPLPPPPHGLQLEDLRYKGLNILLLDSRDRSSITSQLSLKTSQTSNIKSPKPPNNSSLTFYHFSKSLLTDDSIDKQSLGSMSAE